MRSAPGKWGSKPVAACRRIPSPALSRGLGRVLVLAGSALAACNSDGAPPPPGRLYFPVALEISPVGDHLVVANSNFDLRYNSGSLQTYDLEVMNTALDEHCGGVDADETCGIIPVEDQRDDLTEGIREVSGLLLSEVLIGSFADGLVLAESGEGARAYLPVRSEGDLTTVDLDASGRLSCGDTEDSTDIGGARHRCTNEYTSTDVGAATEEGFTVPSDPVAVAVGPRALRQPGALGNFLVMAHRGGRLSLFFDEPGQRPELIDVLEGLPNELVEVAIDRTGNVWAANAFDPVIARAGLAIDPTPRRSFLFRSSDLLVSGIDTGAADRGDTREIAFDPRETVNRAYVLARRPRGMLVIDLDESVGATAVDTTVQVCGNGPSRLDVETFPETDVEGVVFPERTLAFATCFDSRDLFVVDVDAGRLVGIVRSLGGPFELAVDVDRRRVYVDDFRTSVIRVLDLDPMFECLANAPGRMGECSPQELGFVGRPRAVQELI